ncbi:DNA (cytosine-5-)-methyltransferase [Kineococcus xinjiangensis]|uniref:DNA (cytosine-5-)-methyltransferase n=1 Tax=Kineococcus xinjiangensis TaxID=512762 RepID=UPI000CEC1605
MANYGVVEICAGAGGQALGLERAGFDHLLAVEIDKTACETLKANREHWDVKCGDVADEQLWHPRDFASDDESKRVALLAGGVPCPPFSIAGKQLGASDERDLFSWAVEACDAMRPRALLLENVRGLSMPRFAAYRQRILDRLAEMEYVGFWKLLQASHFGVAQLRPRFVLVALSEADAPYFRWPEEKPADLTVGEALRELMDEHGWEHLEAWVEMANKVAPTIVGGSKKHGGADLGPTRAKAAWRLLGVDAMGVADDAPARNAPHPMDKPPKLTVEMVARLQGWDNTMNWHFEGRKTAKYRQVGNAFPPPVAEALGRSIKNALDHIGEPREMKELDDSTAHDHVYRILKEAGKHIGMASIKRKLPEPYGDGQLERRIAHLSRDFVIDIKTTKQGPEYKLLGFKGFIGQDDHDRHAFFADRLTRSRIS